MPNGVYLARFALVNLDRPLLFLAIAASRKNGELRYSFFSIMNLGLRFVSEYTFARYWPMTPIQSS